MAKPGPKTKYRTEFCKQAEKLTAIGVARCDIAAFLDVSLDSLERWEKLYPELAAAIKKGESVRKIRLLQAMARNAFDNNNVAMQIFLSKNWLGYRDVQEQAIRTDVPIRVEIIPAKPGGNGQGGNGGDGDGQSKP